MKEIKAVTITTKVWLLTNCSILLYTPAGEHFGIVPLEAMYCGTPVLAVNSGGPLETIDHGVTGWLVDGQPNAWSEVAGSNMFVASFNYNVLTFRSCRVLDHEVLADYLQWVKLGN